MSDFFVPKISGNQGQDSVISDLFLQANPKQRHPFGLRYVSASEEADNDGVASLDNMPGRTSTPAKIRNLLAQGHIHLAVQLLQNSLIDATGEDVKKFMDLSHDTLDWLESNYQYETALIGELSSTIDTYDQLSTELESIGWTLGDLKTLQSSLGRSTSGIGFDGVQNDVHALTDILDELLELSKNDMDLILTEAQQQEGYAANPAQSKNTGLVTKVASAQSVQTFLEDLQRAEDAKGDGPDLEEIERRRRMSIGPTGPAPSFGGMAA